MSAQFHLKLRRDDVEPEDMPEVTETELIEPPVLMRPEWIGTINEVQVQYPERIWAKVHQEIGRDVTNPDSMAVCGTLYRDGSGVNVWHPEDETTWWRAYYGYIYHNNFWYRYHGCVWFPQLTIIKGSFIHSAKLVCVTRSVYPKGVNIYGCLQPNPVYPVSGNDFWGRPRTESYTPYSSMVFYPEGTPTPPVPPHPYTDQWVYWDVTAIVQDIVNQKAFIRNNSAMFMFMTMDAEYPYQPTSESLWTKQRYAPTGPYLEIWWEFRP